MAGTPKTETRTAAELAGEFPYMIHVTTPKGLDGIAASGLVRSSDAKSGHTKETKRRAALQQLLSDPKRSPTEMGDMRSELAWFYLARDLRSLPTWEDRVLVLDTAEV
jgi:hypothetical protein